MQKFSYTNSNGISSIFEAIPLTSDLYSDLLLKDREVLQKIINEEIEELKNNSSYKTLAEQMLKKHGLGKEGSFSSNNLDGEIMYVLSKEIISEETPGIKKNQSTQQILRSYLPSNKIRLFKKNKMQYDI